MIGSRTPLVLLLALCAVLCKNSSGFSIGIHRRNVRCTACFRSTMQLPIQRDRCSGFPLFSAHDDNQEVNSIFDLTQVSGYSNAHDSSAVSSDSIEIIAPINSTSSSHNKKSPLGLIRRIKSFNKQSLSKLGMSALLSYGFVSNVSGVLAVSSAWFIFSKRTGLSPIAPGQRTPFLALYAGFTVALNILRPARFALSMAISPYFERLRNFIQKRLGVTARVSALVVILCINIIGTCTLMGCGVGLASVLSGVPIWRVSQ